MEAAVSSLDGYNVLRVNNAAGVALAQMTTTGATRWVPWPLTVSAAVDSAKQEADDDDVIELDAVAPDGTPNAPSLDLHAAHFQFPVEFEVVASADGLPAQNLVVFLHGRGDSHLPFARLGAQMALPQTAAVSLRAPLELPFDMGRTWCHDLDDAFDVIPPHVSHSGRSQSLEAAREFVWSFLQKLRDSYHWPLERVFLFGFSQGASVAFHVAMKASCRLGGVVLVAGGAVHGPHAGRDPTSRAVHETPAVMICGQRDEVFPTAMAEETERQFTSKFNATLFSRHVVKYKAHDMIRSRDEMRVVMEFFSKHLYLRDVALESRSDVMEITSRRHQ